MYVILKQGELVTQFGSIDWQVSVRLLSDGNSTATLAGTTSVSFVGGYADFTDLTISHPGSGMLM